MIVRKVKVDCPESPPSPPRSSSLYCHISHHTGKVEICGARARASLLFKWEAPLDDFTDFKITLKTPEWKQSLINNIKILRSLFSRGSFSGVTTIHHCTAQCVPFPSTRWRRLSAGACAFANDCWVAVWETSESVCRICKIVLFTWVRTSKGSWKMN